ncbi:site-specific integrase [Ideonella paludis]|uniref:Phage integrase N-terminal SAM-like domain-containing protein n=2 Tax=Ideonella paludis TaxID=1233411 RepID=A0ABS5DWV0_9BURK|nr:site-specific integrase [Ideonella paludis]MBQ0935623.1 phage integrase N-terminal SAM-like domain-containing protein [Ideonella paludis]
MTTTSRHKMLNAMVVRGLAPRTQEAYVDALARMAKHLKRSPDTLDAAEIDAYMVHLARDCGNCFSTINHVASASRFLFRHV